MDGISWVVEGRGGGGETGGEKHRREQPKLERRVGGKMRAAELYSGRRIQGRVIWVAQRATGTLAYRGECLGGTGSYSGWVAHKGYSGQKRGIRLVSNVLTG